VRVLVAEDDPVARTLLTALLRKWGYDPVPVGDGAEAWGVLTEASPPRIAVLDWEMPEIDGPELCRRIRNRVDEPPTYVILLTARDADTSLVAGLDAGADCYLTKPCNAPQLQAQLGAARRIAERQQVLYEQREALRHQSLHDPLTGLFNRAGVMQALHADIADVSRNGGALGVAMVDLDRFKRINDTWGHAAGDDVLVEAARRIRTTLRPYDHVGRVGGEELLIVAPRCDSEGLRKLGERVRAAIADQPVPTRAGPLEVTASLGLAWADVGFDADRMLIEADKALYRAKRTGRNKVVDFRDPDESSLGA
jgi:two-component system, cell cycle response regulator